MTDLLFVWFPLIGALAVVCVGLYFLQLGIRTFVKAVLLKRGGVVTKGVITRRYRERIRVTSGDDNKRRTGYRYNLDYAFHVSGERFVVTRAYPSKLLWDSVSEGDGLDIVYLSDNPDNNRLAETRPHRALIGGTIQTLAGAFLMASCAGFLIAGFMGVLNGPDRMQAGANWVADQGIVLWIDQSDDPFVRIVRPQTRVVRFEIGDDDGGRTVVGQVDIPLETDEFPDLKVGDVYPVLRDPEDKGKAVLKGLQ